MRGREETLVDLYVGESVFERMLLFVIEKASPPPHTHSEGQGWEGGELLLDVLISAESAISVPHSLSRWVPLDQDMRQSAITRREKVT